MTTATLSRRPAAELIRDYGVVLTVVVLFVFLALSSDAFLTRDNLLNIVDQSAPMGIIAVAMTLVIIAGGFDLSAGAVFAIAGVLAALTANAAGAWLGFGAAVAAGAALGLFNGLLITGLQINSFVATLASSLMIRGVAVVITGGTLVTVSHESFTTLGRAEVAGIKYDILVFLAVVLAGTFVLDWTKLGRYIYAVGGNPEAARLSGIRVAHVQALTFVISGAAAGLAGAISASKVSTGQADAGTLLELSAIAAVVIGGTSVMGGEGTVWRSVLGVLLLTLIGNGFNILEVEPFYQSIVQGAIIVIAVAVDAWSKRRS